MIRIGTRIRRAREKRNITQGELVRRSGLQASYVSKVENGLVMPGLHNLERMARAIDITLPELLQYRKRRP